MKIQDKNERIVCDKCGKNIIRRYNSKFVCAICNKDVCPNCRSSLSKYIKNPNDTYDGYTKQICFLCFDCLVKAFPKLNSEEFVN